MPEFGGIGGFAAGAMAANQERLAEKKMRIDEMEANTRLFQLDQEKQKFQGEQLQKALVDSANRMKALGEVVKTIGPNFKPGSALDKAIDTEKGILAKAAEINGQDPRLAQAAADAVRAYALQPQKIEGFGPGQTLVQNGQVVGQTPQAPTSFEQNVRALADNELKRGALGGGVNVNVENMGNIPAGFELLTDPATGAKRMQAIAGGPAAQKIEAEDKAATAKLETGRKQASFVSQEIDQALKLVGPFTAGLGAPLSKIPASAARSLAAKLNTIKSNVGFDRLQQMRDASPTGGALGNVSNVELELLQATLGSLDQALAPEQLREHLTRLREVFLDIVHGADRKSLGAPGADDADFDFDPRTGKVVPRGTAAPAAQRKTGKQ
jgi:hypothetical protein